MKKKTFLWSLTCIFSGALLCFSLEACLKSDGAPLSGKNTSKGQTDRFEGGFPVSGQHLERKTAKRMVQSYLDGINYRVNASAIRAWTVNADSLRSFAADGSIKYFTFTLAHTLDYITAGHEGQRPDSNSHPYTLVVSGLDSVYRTVTLPDGTLLDQMVPCPDLCAGVDTGQ